jgi:hypothetical protein
MPRITPNAKDIVQGSTKKPVLGQKRVSALASLLSPDMSKPETDFDLGLRDGRQEALRKFTEGRGEFPENYEEYERGRKLARNAVGGILGLTPEPEFPGPVAVVAKGKK